MSDLGNDSSPDVRSLLQREREISPVPALVRARVMARAQAAIAAGPAVYTARTRPAPVRWAVAAGVIFVAAGAVGAAAYEMRVRLDRHAAAPQLAVAALARPAPEAPARPARERPPAAEPELAPPLTPRRGAPFTNGRGTRRAAPLAAGARRGRSPGLRRGAAAACRGCAPLQGRPLRRRARGAARARAGGTRTHRRGTPGRAAVPGPVPAQRPSAGRPADVDRASDLCSRLIARIERRVPNRQNEKKFREPGAR